MLKLMGKKILKVYAGKVCLSKPVAICTVCLLGSVFGLTMRLLDHLKSLKYCNEMMSYLDLNQTAP